MADQSILTQSSVLKLDLQATETIEPSEAMAFSEPKNKPTIPLFKRRRSSRFLDLKSPKVKNNEAEISIDALKQEERIPEVCVESKKTSVVTKTIQKRMLNNTFFEENTDLFEERLDLKALRYISQRMTLETFNKNEIIYEKDQETNGKIYLIYKGEVGMIFQPKEPGSFSDEVDKFNSSGRVHEEKTSAKFLPKIAKQSFLLYNLNEDDERTTNDSNETSPTQEKKRREINLYLGPAVSKILKSDEYFGGEVMLGKERREDTAIAKTDLEVLVIKSEDLEYVKYRYEKRRVEKFNSFLENLSLSFGTAEKENQLFELLTERTLPFGEVFLSEGDTGKSIYFLCKGKCEIQKRSKGNLPAAKANFKRNITVGVIGDGTFIGEEIIFGKSLKYDYTVRVASSRAEFLIIDSSVLMGILDEETLALINQRYSQKIQKYQSGFDSLSHEFSKMSGETCFTPKNRSGTPLFPDLESNSNIFNSPNTSQKKRLELQADCDRAQTPSMNVHIAKRNSVKVFCHHQLLSPKQARGQAEISSTAQPKFLEPISSPNGPTNTEKTNFMGQKIDSLKSRFMRANSFNVREVDSQYEVYPTGLHSNSPSNSDKSPLHEKLDPLEFGEVKKKSQFARNLKDISPSHFKDQSKKKLEILEPVGKGDMQTKNSAQLFVENHLNGSMNSSNTMWWLQKNMKYDAQNKLPELKDINKGVKCNRKSLPPKRENLDQDQFNLKGFGLNTVKQRVILKKLPEDGGVLID